jgi:hypothetical protein
MRLQNFVIGPQILSLDYKLCYWTTKVCYKDYKYPQKTETWFESQFTHGTQHVLLMGPPILLLDYKFCYWTTNICYGTVNICYKDHKYFVMGLQNRRLDDLNHSSPMVQHVLLWSPYKDFVMGLQNLKCPKSAKSTWNAKLDQNAILWTPIFTPRARLDITPS